MIMPMRLIAVPLVLLATTAPAWSQSAQEIGQMKLYIQQLEDRVRQLTGDVERLTYELNQARAQVPQEQGASPTAQGWQTGGYGQPAGQFGNPPSAGQFDKPPSGGGALTTGSLPVQPGAGPGTNPEANSIAQDDPRIAADGDGLGGTAPLDLSALASGAASVPLPQSDRLLGSLRPSGQAAPAQLAALGSGTPREEYDAAYGYVLTGDYGTAEARLSAWLEAFPNEAQAPDARFWLGESEYQQGKFREAAGEFLNVYKSWPQSRKAPDSLVKLGMSLGQLGEKDAACATLSEVGRRYPDASSILKTRVDEQTRDLGC
ncbi:tol-pal system protein YbgF [Rhizobiales bacterium L72]|uniref:Cell division coordinator CpoB n=2 Tax=Propylenella binzhouense TaxID=2555902 RepID=A0A964WTL4_9HYPH|nr:tol-pal system protein YbgF [Propylenella binzhouense]